MDYVINLPVNIKAGDTIYVIEPPCWTGNDICVWENEVIAFTHDKVLYHNMNSNSLYSCRLDTYNTVWFTNNKLAKSTLHKMGKGKCRGDEDGYKCLKECLFHCDDFEEILI